MIIAHNARGEDAADAWMLIGALRTGFEGLNRGCEYTTDGNGKWEAHRHLSSADFHYREYVAAHGQRASWINVKSAKNDQFGEWRHDPVYLHKAADAIVEFLKLRPSTAADPRQEPLFRLRDGPPLKQDTLRRRLRELLASCGVPDARRIGLHALRAGGATALHAAGMSDDSIRRRGRWRSDCYRRYLRDNFAESQRCLHAMFDPSLRGAASVEWLSKSENDSIAAAVLWDTKFEERTPLGGRV